MKRLFIETTTFSNLIDSYGDKKILLAIQNSLLLDLQLNIQNRDIIKGSGGFTKLRVADTKNARGKSAGLRVIYFDLPDIEVVFLFLLYPKSAKENLTAKELLIMKEASKELKKWQPSKKKL